MIRDFARGKAPGRLCAALAMGLALTAPAAIGQQATTAVELPPNGFENFATANFLPRGAFKLDGGTQTTGPWVDTPGTGNQNYYAGLTYALRDGLEIGVDYMNYNDPPPYAIAGAFEPMQMAGGGAWAKYRLFERGNMTVATQVAAEFFQFDSTVFAKDGSEFVFIGSVQAPITFDIAPRLQAHLTPGVSVFPSTRDGNEFFGTVASIGAGLSYKPSRRTLVFGTVTQPLTGKNTILSDGSYARRPVFTLGGRYNFAPNSGVEAYVTNGIGTTPTTGVINFFPDGDIPMFGIKLVHTFGPGTPKNRPEGRGPFYQVMPRQRMLAGDGFTLLGPRTRERGTGALTVFAGTQGAYGAMATIAADHFLELGASFESLSDDGSGSSGQLTSDADRWTGHFKLQFMEQYDGDPVSLAFDAQFGRDREKNGALFLAAPAMYEVNPKLALKAVPKGAFYGDEREYGLGLGAIYAAGRYVNVFGEYTLRNTGDNIWALGAKGRVPNSPIEVGLHATNAIGAYGVNSMTSQEDPKVVLSVTLLQGLFR